MTKEIGPSSYECACGHVACFPEDAVREAKDPPRIHHPATSDGAAPPSDAHSTTASKPRITGFTASPVLSLSTVCMCTATPMTNVKNNADNQKRQPAT